MSAPAVTAQLTECAFCGLHFDPGCAEAQSKSGCTASCPLGAGCGQGRCPRCGYPVLAESSLARWLRNAAKHLKHKQGQLR